MSVDKASEAALYAQLDANLDSNPKIRKAGAFGRQVFEFLLRRNALRGFYGSVPIAFIDADYLADVLMIAACDAVTGVTKAVTANLIAIDEGSGAVRIVGWHPSWGMRPKNGKDRTREWRERKRSESQQPVTSRDDGDETPSQVTTGDESDAKRREEKRDLNSYSTRAIPRHPDVGGVARRVWSYGSTLRIELAAANVNVPPWPDQHGTEHAGWVALLERVGERLVGSTAEGAEQICRNRLDVAAAKARDSGEGNWFSAISMFSRKSFDTFAELDPKQFGRKAAKKHQTNGTIGSATPRTDHGETMKPAREVM